MSDTDPGFRQLQRREHLRGWLSYAFASEVFVVVSLTLFLPICLEQFARDNGRLLPDKTLPCTTSAESQAPTPVADGARCVVKLGWAWIDTASFSLYVYSASVALQAITVISMGSIADDPVYRKRLLLGFAFTGATAATLFLLLSSSSALWAGAGLLAIVANVCFGASIVALNAYLPLLARESDEAASARTALLAAGGSVDPARTSLDELAAPLLREASDTHGEAAVEPIVGDAAAAYATAVSAATARISSQGIALGYSAGIALLLLALIPVTLMKGSTLSLRLAIGASGLWWALGTLPAAGWLPVGTEATDEPGEADEWSARPAGRVVSARKHVLRDVGRAWARLVATLHPKEVAQLRNTFKYLAAWFLLSDGFTTITSTAILFGKTVLGMSPSALILVGVLTPSAGIAGALVWPRVQRAFGWSSLRVLTTLVVLASLIPAYGCLGFLPPFRNGNVKFGGLTTQGEMFGLAIYFGAVYGAFQSYARALYSEIIPPGEEARWYGLFSITDKSSSFVGPLLVGLISDTTGDIRYAFFFLVIMVWAAVPILASVDMQRGREDARTYSKRGRT